MELLAITDTRVDSPPPMRQVAHDSLRALCIPVDTSSEVTPEELWRREELLESLMERHDLLPVRFGTVVEDERAVHHALAERGDEFAAMLDRVRGAVELAVRAREATPSDHKESFVHSGHAYMRSKAQQMESVGALHDPLAMYARESLTWAGPERLRAAYLVDRDRVEDFVRIVRGFQRRHPELHVLCTGPWPPYSFVTPENR
jgi:Gas vesicle synthesis protein GvpL/GvpF